MEELRRGKTQKPTERAQRLISKSTGKELIICIEFVARQRSFLD
jgi:hypothetical protein